MQYKYNDGGRYLAGYKAHTGDCVTRSIAIVTGMSYQEVYDKMNELAKPVNAKPGKRMRGKSSARTGMHKKAYHNWLLSIGYKWVPTMLIGEGCRVHLTDRELPAGRLIVQVSRHLTAVIDGVINDLYNPDRNGTRCVYGYYIKTN